jgi:hypothetical protein
MPQLHRYRIFISHAWSYNADYYQLVDRLDETRNFLYANYSVPEHDPVDAYNNTKLKEELRQQIRPVEVVIILGGMYVAASDWIQFELDFAKHLNKPILGVRPWGTVKIPKSVQDAADEIVGWDAPTIVSAIQRLAQNGRTEI